MGLEIESRPSDSPYIERVWRSRSIDVDHMTSVANARWDLVFWEQRGELSAGIQGPETGTSRAPVPDDASFFGIVFALGTAMSHIPVGSLVDGFAELSCGTRRTIWLKASAWERPTYDNAEVFVRRLVREGVLERDRTVAAVLAGGAPGVSDRTVQRRFVAATGLTRTAIRQVERARQAAVLLQEGALVADVVHRLGYYDQPHLGRSLARFIGRTAGELGDRRPAEPLSLLYKT